MSVKYFMYHELLSTVPDKLLVSNGYPPKSGCNCSGPFDEVKNKITLGNSIIFGSKQTELESAFDDYVVEKNKDHAWAISKTENSDWRKVT